MADERDERRVRAWGAELRDVHRRLREALDIAQKSVDDASGDVLTADLLIYCHGFCAALDGHHRGENAAVFPEVVAAHPDLKEPITKLVQDHGMIEHLISELDEAARAGATRGQVIEHLDGIGAIMESHFTYEERVLVDVLDRLDLRVDEPSEAFGPLA